MGINVVDAFRLAKFHNMLPMGRIGNVVPPDEDYDDINEMTIKKFAGILSTQLIYKAYNHYEDFKVEEEELMREPLNPEGRVVDSRGDVRGYDCDDADVGVGKGKACFVTSRSTPCGDYKVGGEGFQASNNASFSSVSMDLTPPMNSSNNEVFDESFCREVEFDVTNNDIKAIDEIYDSNGGLHSAIKLSATVSQGVTTKGKKYVNPRQCIYCGRLSRIRCQQCNKVYCYPLKDRNNVNKSCFYTHVHGKCINMRLNKRKK